MERAEDEETQKNPKNIILRKPREEPFQSRVVLGVKGHCRRKGSLGSREM